MDANTKDYLSQYASVFNAVEGNTTFYGLPKRATVDRWREESPAGFAFCFKFPRIISHDKELVEAGPETLEFLNLLQPLRDHDRLGPLLLQLGPEFDGSQLASIAAYVENLPSDFNYALEVRHLDFFDKGQYEVALNRLLAKCGIDRVVLDSRALFQAQSDDRIVVQVQHRKPRLPVHAIAVHSRPFIRYIGHPAVAANQPFLQPWVKKFVGWIDAGLAPLMFTHMPNKILAPDLGRLFHSMLEQELPAVGKMPDWPIDRSPAARDGQLPLF